MINVMIVEDNATIRQGLSMLIDATEGFCCPCSFADCESMLRTIEKQQPDILLMDIGLPGMSGIEGIKKVQASYPDVDIIVLTVYEENETVLQALMAGACGYLVKKTPPARLLDAIRDAYEGGSPMSSHIARRLIQLYQQNQLFRRPVPPENLLTERELEILTALADGKTYQGISQQLYISVDTVRYHIRNIYRKLHVHTVSEAVAQAFRKGLL